MTPWTLHQADARSIPLPDASVHCVVTSPPYWQLRRYAGVPTGRDSIGEEATVEEYLAHLLEVFREVWRVLRDDGVLWVNIGDTRGGSGGAHKPGGANPGLDNSEVRSGVNPRPDNALNLFGIPKRFALAMQADGWVWRDTIVWHKQSPMPESVSGTAWVPCRVKVTGVKPETYSSQRNRQGEGIGTGWSPAHPELGDAPTTAIWQRCPGCAKCAPNGGLVLRRGSWRCTDAYEQILMFVKGPGYFADGEGVRQPQAQGTFERFEGKREAYPESRRAYHQQRDGGKKHQGQVGEYQLTADHKANLRNVWVLPVEHFAGKFCSACCRSLNKRQIRKVVTEDDDGNERTELLTTCCQAPLLGHYATFPPSLPARCIQIATSEKGVCPECGAQWARVIEHTNLVDIAVGMDNARSYSKAVYQGGPRSGVSASNSHNDSTPQSPETRALGWKATCDHGDLPPVPATVLDPFCGVGTTLLAASRLGRRSVGVELSPQYCELARQRLEAGAPRF